MKINIILPKQIEEDAVDFGLGKCYIRIDFTLCACDDDGELSGAQTIIPSGDLKLMVELCQQDMKKNSKPKILQHPVI